MIKKILLSLGVVLIGFIGFSEASFWCSRSIDNVYSQTIGSLSNYYDNAYSFGGLLKGGILTQALGYGKKILALNSNTLYWREESGLPYMYWNDGFQGNPDKLIICPQITDIGLQSLKNCSCSSLTTGSVDTLSSFFSKIDSGDYLASKKGGGFLVCFSSHIVGNTLCFGISNDINSETHPINSKGYSSINFSNINTDLLFDGPGFLFTGDSGGGDSSDSFNGNVDLSNNDIVSYYEDTRGFNYNMCFVGTWDFTQSEGTFKQGNGEHIFSYFNWFYNLGTGNNSTGYKLSDVGKFIDEMYGNYDIYFNYGNRYSNGDIAYIYKFDINTHILDWIDTGFNNPFDEYTYVYTFYPKTLHYYTDYWRLYYYGGDLANYCYYKLNLNNSPQEDIYGNLENDISQDDLNNIGQWKVISTNFNYTQSGNNITVSEDWSGSPLDYFAVENGSGYENFDASTFFSDSFNRFKGVFGELNPGDFGFGYLPGYIISFLLALIFFRFLSH